MRFRMGNEVREGREDTGKRKREDGVGCAERRPRLGNMYGKDAGSRKREREHGRKQWNGC